MKIQLTSTTKFHTALALAGKRRFFDALALFSQSDIYESYVNQIVCLCQMRDIACAIDLYRDVKQRFGEEYAVYEDLNDFGDLVSDMLQFSDPDAALARNTEGQKRADKSLLLNCETADDDDYSTPDLDYFSDSALFYDENFVQKKIFDVKSEDYFDFLRVNMERCYMEGNETQANKYAKRLLEVETDHLPTLEAQISLSLFNDKLSAGVKYAERLADVDGGSHAAVGGAIEILMSKNPKKHVETLRKLLKKAEGMLDEVTLFDMEDYVYISTQILKDYEMANSFAEELFRERKTAGVEALRQCAYAFYNVKNLKKAKEAANLLCRVVPRDVAAKALLDYLREADPDDIFTPFEMASRQIRHYFVPDKLGTFALEKFVECVHKITVQKEPLLLDEKEFDNISTIILWCRSMMICNRRKEYSNTVTFIRAVLHSFRPQDPESFFEFAKSHLFSVMADHAIGEFLLSEMLKNGYHGSLLVSFSDNSYYRLDCSAFQNLPQGEFFCHVFAICATLVPIYDVEKYWNTFSDICDNVVLSDDLGELIHQFAYALLCLCEKDFATSSQADIFAETDNQILNKYLGKKTKKN